MTLSNFRNYRGFTFIELLITLSVLGVAMFPIMNMFISGKKGTMNVFAEARANSLAMEKIEILRMMPYSRVVSDIEIFQSCFIDTFVDEFKLFDDNNQAFEEGFSDVWTEDFVSRYPKLYEKLKKVWKENYGFEYEPFPDDYDDYRRITHVEPYTPEKDATGLLKVTVYVYYEPEKSDQEELLCELTSVFADR